MSPSVKQKPAINLRLLARLAVLVGFMLSAQIGRAGEELDRIGFSELRSRSDSGDSEAQWQLAFEYHFGHDMPKDEGQARYWWAKANEGIRKLAESGDATAQGLWARTLREGWGVARNFREAQKWIDAGAEHGDILCIRFKIGAFSHWGDDPVSPQQAAADKEQVAFWKTKLAEANRKAAESGNTNAMIEFAWTLAVGRDGVAKDEQEALKWLRKAGESGNVKAQITLGDRYAKRRAGVMEPDMSVPEDKSEARRWYLMAQAFYREEAQAGNPEAQYKYGMLLEKVAMIGYHGQPLRYSSDLTEAAFWWLKAAYQGQNQAQRSLDSAYSNGEGMDPNDVEGFAWEIVTAASSSEYSKEGDEDQVKRSEIYYGPEKTRMARARSREIMAEIKLPSPKEIQGTEADDVSSSTPKASGTGAIVSAQGHVLTAAHVVQTARRIIVVTSTGIHVATVLKVDEANDIAVLKIADGTYRPFPIAPSLRVRLGQSVTTIGFPNVEIQGFSPKVTRGEISSLSGAGDDPRCWQISAPVQPGNSGGPLLDECGNLIGIVVAKLGFNVARATGDMPQNVNYAVKSAYALPLLEPYLGSDAPEPIGLKAKPVFEDMISTSQTSVVLVVVY